MAHLAEGVQKGFEVALEHYGHKVSGVLESLMVRSYRVGEEMALSMEK